MELKFYKSYSTVKPVELEKAKHTVYIRKNFVETESGWSYDEAEVSHEEFDAYCKLKSFDDGDQLIIMEAIADLYEMITNLQIGGVEE